MSRIKSLADLKKIRERQLAGMQNGGRSELTENLVQVKVAMATCGIASGARKTMEFMIDALEKRGIDAAVTQVGCMGYCYAEPTVEVKLPGAEPLVFGGVNIEKADEIIEKYIKCGEEVDGIIPVNYQTVD